MDPAAGAGIFLVLALQRLVAEKWKATGERPNTQGIRDILNDQIRGYDINHSALTLAALSLYLTALELDPDPFPPEKLRFDRLMGSVLRNMRGPGEAYPYDGIVLGSLGELGDLPPNEEPFHIVTGNPPWTSFKAWGDEKYNFNDYVRDMVCRIIKKRRDGNPEQLAIAESYVHNDMLPDTAFMWRAIEWARNDGVIAFIVAGRLLFKRGEAGAGVRDSLFRCMRVRGVLNGALLLPLWPQINQPFCVVFARNSVPKPTDRFTFITPVLDSGPAGQVRMRIDSEARQPIELQTLFDRPHLLKILTRGGRLDVDIVERIQELAKPNLEKDQEEGLQLSLVSPVPAMKSIEAYWRDWSNGKKRFGQGYIPPGKKTNQQTTETRKRITELLSREALMLTSDDLFDEAGELRIGLRINPRQLERFKAMKLYRLAEPDVFTPPLVLINEGFGESPQDIRARLYLGKAPLVFRRNFYGFSCAGHPKAQQLAKYLFCIVNSDLFGFYTLQVSAKFGLERRTLLVQDIEEFPILHSLSESQFNAVEKVADELDHNVPASWRAMNHCINNLYGLTPADEQVMKDTLATMMPYKTAQSKARTQATRRELEAFRTKVETMLQPFFDMDEEKVQVTQHELPVEGWVTFDITTSGTSAGTATDDAVSQIAAQLADDEGASRSFHVVGERHIRISIRNQYRYLTLSRARLCALDVLREHGNVFPIRGNA